MKSSIRTRLILILSVFLVVFVTLIIMMNLTFLEKFYSQEKKKVLENIYSQVYDLCRKADTGSDTEELSDDFYSSLDGLGANNGVSIYVFSMTTDGLYQYYDFKYPDVDPVANAVKNVKFQLDDYMSDYYGYNALPNNFEVVEETSKYKMYRVYDDKIGSNYIEIFGKTDNTTFVYLRANYQNIKESVDISNKFITYIGVVFVIIGAIVMFFIGSVFTKPILQLADIADKMTELDFDVRYEVKSDDEIGRLGTSMNILSERLEHTVSELKSANNELQRDIERKVQIDEMRQEFLSNVSHELKTPIALIQGYAEGLTDNVIDDPEDRKFYCDVIMDEAQKMNRMVKRLLNLNQLEFGNEQPNMERFDIVEVIKSVAASSDILFKQKNVELVMYEPNPVYVWADEYLVEEVLTNYVSNAINHVAEPNRIEIFTKKKGDIVRVSVRNTGEPIPADEIDKIWVKFYKVDKARTREYGGNGIGLSIVKAIIERYEGRCGVDNKTDGVEFWFELNTNSK